MCYILDNSIIMIKYKSAICYNIYFNRNILIESIGGYNIHLFVKRFIFR
jgi:hypothetical protein